MKCILQIALKKNISLVYIGSWLDSFPQSDTGLIINYLHFIYGPVQPLKEIKVEL